MKISSLSVFILFVGAVAAEQCAQYTWGDECQYQECGCDGNVGNTCPGGTVGGLPCCEFCPVNGWDCKCGDGCEGTDNCCMYCPSRYLGVGESMKPFYFPQTPKSIVASRYESRDQSGAARACPAYTELVYLNSAYAVAELEVYINRFIEQDIGDHEYWVDGYAPKEGALTSWQDWEEVSRTKTDFCLLLSNKHPGTTNLKSWEVRAGPCTLSRDIKSICKDADAYYGTFHRALEVYRPPRSYGAYYAGEVNCAGSDDPYVAIHSEAEGDQLFNELERLGYERDSFFLRGYTDLDPWSEVEVKDIIQAPVKRGEDAGRTCVEFRTENTFSERRRWNLLATPCRKRLATISVCWEEWEFVLY